MEKKGFTLVELLAVVVLMAILITVAVPGVMRVSKSLKVQSYCSKIEIIESAALEYANDYFLGKEVSSNEKVTLDNISLMNLIDLGYLTSDNPMKTVDKLTEDEKKEREAGKQFCILYDKDSNCLVDPRDDSSMDYNLVRIWSANKRIYASFRYNSSDVYNDGEATEENGSFIDGVCGEKNFYETNDTSVDDIRTTVYEWDDLGTFKDGNIANKPMIKGKYNWSSYKSFRTTRTDNIPGNYYIKNVKLTYNVSTNTRMQIMSGDLFNKDDIVTSDSATDSNVLEVDLKDKHLSNLDISYRVALNTTVRKKDAYGQIAKIEVTWDSLENLSS